MAQSIEQLKARLLAIPQAVREDVNKTLLKQANDLADSMKNLAPVDTGALRDSITVTPGGTVTPPYSTPGGSHLVPTNAVAVTVGDEGVRYAHLVEYGTANAEKQPYFWPAYRLHKRRIKSAIGRAIGKAVRSKWVGSS